MGEKREDRVVIVSIFGDGLSLCPELVPPPTLSFLKYRPWIAQEHPGLHPFTALSKSSEDNNNITTSDITKAARKEIYKLIDQPRECIREGIDEIDFARVERDNLSTYPAPSSGPNDWMLVDSPEKMQQCIEELEQNRPSEIAFDLEAHNKNKYAQLTCLFQLTSNVGKEYVIDVLAPGVWDAVGGLAPLFSDPKIVKIGHAIGGLDVQCLHRDFGIFVVNAFDTQEAAQELRLERKGLAWVCGHYGLKDCDKYNALKEKYQNCDWRTRPLTDPMIEYGRYDIHYLIELRRLMMRDLTKSELWGVHDKPQEMEIEQPSSALADILRECAAEEDGEYEYKNGRMDPQDEEDLVEVAGMKISLDVEADPGDHGTSKDIDMSHPRQSLCKAQDLRMNPSLMRVTTKSLYHCIGFWNLKSEPPLKDSQYIAILKRCKKEGTEFSSAQVKLYKTLASWRDGIAKKEKCLATFVCPLGFLALVSYKRPTSELALRRLTYFLPGILEDERKYVEELLEIVNRSRAETGLPSQEDIPLFQGGADQTGDRSTGGGEDRPMIWAGTLLIVSAIGLAVSVAARARKR